ncbi:unnamed protein product [Cyprideis torosa]|uniref:Uncharacterized protein n=1 Tax=Cyprideis torosa TaxID=163714 RepID=A0A7R8W8P8_9CRUS|nr:unnamed protein product [Cyprideis torosa]CAG0883431.1 unnamed protein product [Cyprideis torosa]
MQLNPYSSPTSDTGSPRSVSEASAMDSSSYTSSTNRAQRNQAEKHRREKMNEKISELANMVPTVALASKKCDKTSILRLAANYFRLQELKAEHRRLSRKRGWPRRCAPIDKLLEAFDSFLLVVTGSGRITFASQSVERFFGHCPIDLHGRELKDIVHVDDQPIVDECLRIDNCDDEESSFRSFPCRLVSRCLTRSKPGQMEVSISGHMRRKPGCRVTRSGPGSLEDWNFTAIVTKRKKSARIEVLLLQGLQDEYYTRHNLDGTLVNVDHSKDQGVREYEEQQRIIRTNKKDSPSSRIRILFEPSNENNSADSERGSAETPSPGENSPAGEEPSAEQGQLLPVPSLPEPGVVLGIFRKHTDIEAALPSPEAILSPTSIDSIQGPSSSTCDDAASPPFAEIYPQVSSTTATATVTITEFTTHSPRSYQQAGCIRAIRNDQDEQMCLANETDSSCVKDQTNGENSSIHELRIFPDEDEDTEDVILVNPNEINGACIGLPRLDMDDLILGEVVLEPDVGNNLSLLQAPSTSGQEAAGVQYASSSSSFTLSRAA